ncbi:Alpha/Beta hydrolase fold [Rhypophila sp. PSN 637]
MADQKYYIKDAILKAAPHHESFEKLWETKWKEPCSQGIYPFMFGDIADFKPVVERIIKKGLKEPYNWDEYAECFFSQAELLSQAAQRAEAAGHTEDACRLYLRSSAVYRIARFPAPRSEKQRQAWQKGKDVFYKGARLMTYPITEQIIPHTHRLPHEGESIPINILIPPCANASSPVPLLIIFTGLDGYRTELAVWQRGFLDKNVTTIVVEIPGTGDSPADPSDPTSPDRQWSSLLDWVSSSPVTQGRVDISKIIIWGFSTGGYYSLRAGHTHGDRLLGAVSLGGGAHHMFDADWLDNVNKLEYPFDLANTLAYKFGYGRNEDSASGLEEFKRQGAKFSLLEDGTLKKRTKAKILVVNGDMDEIFPIEDLWVATDTSGPRGTGNEIVGRVVKGKKHMGEPESFFIILEWIHGLFGLDGDVVHHLKMLRPKGRL